MWHRLAHLMESRGETTDIIPAYMQTEAGFASPYGETQQLR